MEDGMTALMVRTDIIKDGLTDLAIQTGQQEQRLDRVEKSVDGMANVLEGVATDVRAIKAGPVYSLDRFITVRVAQTTGGFGLMGVLIYLVWALVL